MRPPPKFSRESGGVERDDEHDEPRPGLRVVAAAVLASYLVMLAPGLFLALGDWIVRWASAPEASRQASR